MSALTEAGAIAAEPVPASASRPAPAAHSCIADRTLHLSSCFSISPQRQHWWRGDPRERWPQETSDLHPWLAANLSALARVLDMTSLDLAGREVAIGQQEGVSTLKGMRWVGGLRLDLDLRDERGRRVVVEAQIGAPDHAHFGQLVSYAYAAQAEVAVWVVADSDPLFVDEHLQALADLNMHLAGRHEFAVVRVTLESTSSTAPHGPGLLIPWLDRVDVATGLAGPKIAALVRSPLLAP